MTTAHSDPGFLAALAALDVDPRSDEYQKAYRNELIRTIVRDALAEERNKANDTDVASNGGDLEVLSTTELEDRVAELGPQSWLLEGLWIAHTAIVIAAAQKTGKTVAIIDLAVAVATAGLWQGTWQVQGDPGVVLLFLAEDNEHEVLRRLKAVCDFYQVDPRTLPIYICFSAPNLSSEASMLKVEAHLARLKPRVAILDPLYLAAGSDANAADLFTMGPLLNRFKLACLPTRTSPGIVTHFRKTDGAKGAGRITGVGPQAWGRTLLTGEAGAGRKDDDGWYHSTITWEQEGNSIEPKVTAVVRSMKADDPKDLNSPLRYKVEPLSTTSPATPSTGATGRNPLSAPERVFQALRAHGGWMTKSEVQDWDAQHPPVSVGDEHVGPMKGDTVFRALETLEKEGRVQRGPVRGRSVTFALPGVLPEELGTGQSEGTAGSDDGREFF